MTDKKTGGERPHDGECVGPVLTAGAVAEAIIAAIESALSRSFRLPGDLEQVMPSFRGRFQVSEDQASWSLGAPERRSS